MVPGSVTNLLQRPRHARRNPVPAGGECMGTLPRGRRSVLRGKPKRDGARLRHRFVAAATARPPEPRSSRRGMHGDLAKGPTECSAGKPKRDGAKLRHRIVAKASAPSAALAAAGDAGLIGQPLEQFHETGKGRMILIKVPGSVTGRSQVAGIRYQGERQKDDGSKRWCQAPSQICCSGHGTPAGTPFRRRGMHGDLATGLRSVLRNRPTIEKPGDHPHVEHSSCLNPSIKYRQFQLKSGRSHGSGGTV
jgi:hypothetical protein